MHNLLPLRSLKQTFRRLSLPGVRWASLQMTDVLQLGCWTPQSQQERCGGGTLPTHSTFCRSIKGLGPFWNSTESERKKPVDLTLRCSGAFTLWVRCRVNSLAFCFWCEPRSTKSEETLRVHGETKQDLFGSHSLAFCDVAASAKCKRWNMISWPRELRNS